MDNKIIFAHLNIRSLLPKLNDLKEHLTLNNYSILCLTETWLTPAISDDVLQVGGYILLRRDRMFGRGGGVCMYIKNSIISNRINGMNASIEQLWVKLNINRQQYAVGVAYKPPNYSYTEFINILEVDVSTLLPQFDETFILGDFNIDVLKTDAPASNKLCSMLEALSLTQIVNAPTRIALNSISLIDLIIVSNNYNSVVNAKVLPVDHLSDHDLILVVVNVVQVQNKPTFKNIRDFRSFNQDIFYANLLSLPLEDMNNLQDVSDKVELLNNHLISLLDRHAPTRKIRITKQYSPWLTDNLRLLFSLRNKAKSRWRRTKNPAHYDYYKMLRNYSTLACKNEKKAYFDYILRQHGANTVWKDIKKLNICKRVDNIPDHLSDPEEINNYYINNITQLPTDQETIHYYEDNPIVVDPFTFKPVSDFRVQQLLFTIKSNAFGSDGLNIKFILMCCPHILPFLTNIVNTCLSDGVFPKPWKHALVLPVPKKSGIMEFGDLRPISILPAMSKVVEKEVEAQLRNHVTKYNILPETQSGFRPSHSCETALLDITDDILRGIDAKKLTVLVLLDYTKAFDTINHDIMLAILKNIGITGNSLNFFRHYLTGRCQSVKIEESVSMPLELFCGVPQGSILGPLLFTLYTSDFPSAVKHCKINFYADDTQLHYSFFPDDFNYSIELVNKDIDALIKKSKSHSLSLNASKTSVLLYGAHNSREDIYNRLQITVGDKRIFPSKTARNLGLIFDEKLRFQAHISSCIRYAYMNLKMLYSNRHFFNQRVKTTLCEALVLSKFNFGDTVYGPCLDAESSRRIQVIQNSCLRLIFGIRRGKHVSHKLKELKWLNMFNRRLLHSSCLFHKIMTNKTPAYLINKITFRTDVHNVNIRYKGALTPPLHRTELFKRSFTYQITRVYGSIPDEMKLKSLLAFKSCFKTYLLHRQT